jgi:hypothetical protein
VRPTLNKFVAVMGNKRVMVIMPSASNCAAAMSISV